MADKDSSGNLVASAMLRILLAADPELKLFTPRWVGRLGLKSDRASGTVEAMVDAPDP